MPLIKDYFSLRNAMMLIAALKKENVHREVYLVKSSFVQLEKNCRFLMSSHLNKFKNYTYMPPESLEHHSGHTFVQYYPSEILPGKLYLGDANHATQEYVVRNMKITHIANITNCVPRAFEAENNASVQDGRTSSMVSTDTNKKKRKPLRINYLQVVVCDREDVSLIDYFPDFYWFLENAYSTNMHGHHHHHHA